MGHFYSLKCLILIIKTPKISGWFCWRVESLQGRNLYRSGWRDSNICTYKYNHMTTTFLIHVTIAKLKKQRALVHMQFGREKQILSRLLRQWFINTAALRKRNCVHSTVGAWTCQNNKPWSQGYPCGLPLCMHNEPQSQFFFLWILSPCNSMDLSILSSFTWLFFLMSLWLEVSATSSILFWCLWLDTLSELLFF